MKFLALGALLSLLWLTIGLPVTAPSTVVTAVVAQPVILGFAAGILARPHLTRRTR
ncbi:hypothetical protein NFX46_26715 [Streptomyces phaeoluteigriseus]|uniref:Uncharacterized protein n=1 Tax=Streptomyces phaeoluteigriseus TaxID=114686 RepID=A0ABY4ZD96_9ACTN|nr:hypothetical protein [Streptomyces phaeoluteigriseus]USQ86992.1 hypothetical protein NFX46_26715 [Streptomyces phaeoluteigriseus]